MPAPSEVDQLNGAYSVSMLPCADIDEIADFYTMLGFSQTYRQTRPNPYVALQRADLQLHFFGMDGFDPEQSYGTCGVYVADTGAVYADFAARMRAQHGKVLVAGRPRITRPRKRHNVGGVSGFSVIDPGGNWIRFFRQAGDGAEPQTGAVTATSKLARTYRNAVVIADSHGDAAQAAKIMDSALRAVDSGSPTPADDLAEGLLYRAELAIRLDDAGTARAAIERFREIEPDGIDPETLAGLVVQAEELAEQLD